MIGDNRVRHCAQCDLNVYNFSEMTSEEVAQLVAASKGQRLCGRLYRRVDGTILTRDCPVGVRVLIRRVSRRVGTAFAAAMTAAVAAAQTPRVEPSSPGPSSLVQIQQAETGVQLVVLDESHAVIAHAQITVATQTGTQVAQGITNAVGRIRFPNLAPDNYEVTIQVPGFKTFKIAVVVPARQMVAINATLEVGSLAMMGVVVSFEEGWVGTEPASTFQLIPELALPATPGTETSPTPPVAPPKNSLRKFFRSLGHVLNR